MNRNSLGLRLHVVVAAVFSGGKVGTPRSGVRGQRQRAVPTMEFETRRLILRSFRNEDVDFLAPLMANTDFMRFSLGAFTREQTVGFLDKLIDWERRGLPSQFAVIHRNDNRLIGYCGFFHQQVDEMDEIEIGYRLNPDYWSRGLATEAARAVRDHGFRDLKLPRVISLIHPDICRRVESRRKTE